MRAKINGSMKTAMKEKDTVRLSTLRLINAAIKEREISLRTAKGDKNEVEDAEIMALLGKMIKQREDSAKQYENGGRLELAEREHEEIAVIRDFLPEPMSADEQQAAVAAAIEKTGASSLKDMGAVMAVLKSEHVGRMDFGAASKQIKDLLGPKT